MRSFFILVLLVVVPCAYADNVITFDAHAAWDGYIKSNSCEEITLYIHSSKAFPAVIKASSGKNVIVTHANLLPDITNTARLEIPMLGGEVIDITIESIETKNKVSKTIHLRPIQDNAKLIAIASNDPAIYDIIDRNSQYTFITPRLALFPTDADVYRSISAIVIDNSTFSHFTNKQLSALQQYTSACGLILTYHLDDQYRRALKKYSYCSSDNISRLSHASLLNINTSSSDDTSQTIRYALEKNAASHILYQLLIGASIIAVYFLAILCTVYFALPVRFFVFSVALASIAIYMYYTFLYHGNLEADTLIKVNKYGAGTQNTQLLAIGNYSNYRSITLPRALGLATPTEPKLPYKLRFDSAHHYRITYKQALLKPYIFRLSGPVTYQPIIRTLAYKNKVLVKNISNRMISQGILKWNNNFIYLHHIQPHSSYSAYTNKNRHLHNIFYETYGDILHRCKDCALLEYSRPPKTPYNATFSSHQVILVYL